MSEIRRFGVLLKRPDRALRFARAACDVAQTPPILCASIGRVGSTLSWDALIRSRARALLGAYHPTDWRRISAMRWDLKGARLAAGRVYKTHDFPHDLALDRPMRILFLFGRPSDVVLSVLRCRATEGAAWIADHLRHMHSRDGLDMIFDRDVLRIEEQVDAWFALRGADILCLKYDVLWERREMLSEFVGFDVTLPPRTPRGVTDLDPDLVARVRSAYARLDAKVAALPDHQLIREGVQPR
jgi:hypothetical protein